MKKITTQDRALKQIYLKQIRFCVNIGKMVDEKMIKDRIRSVVRST